MICSQEDVKSVIPFGAYLVRHKCITEKELEAALISQSERNPRFGQLARERELLTFDKIRVIYEYQLAHHVRFGQAAMILGFLTKDEVDSVLAEQTMHHMPLGEVLVDLMILTKERLKEFLHDYYVKVGEVLSETRTPSTN